MTATYQHQTLSKGVVRYLTTLKLYMFFYWGCPTATPAEMEKRADAADASVLFFSLAVLICWLYTRKIAEKELCYLHCAISTVR